VTKVRKSTKTLKDWNIFHCESDKLEKWSGKEMDLNKTERKIYISFTSTLNLMTDNHFLCCLTEPNATLLWMAPLFPSCSFIDHSSLSSWSNVYSLWIIFIIIFLKYPIFRTRYKIPNIVQKASNEIGPSHLSFSSLSIYSASWLIFLFQ
jgi:hypothetical protein